MSCCGQPSIEMSQVLTKEMNDALALIGPDQSVKVQNMLGRAGMFTDQGPISGRTYTFGGRRNQNIVDVRDAVVWLNVPRVHDRYLWEIVNDPDASPEALQVISDQVAHRYGPDSDEPVLQMIEGGGSSESEKLDTGSGEQPPSGDEAPNGDGDSDVVEINASDAAVKLAGSKGIDLSLVEGSGVDGKITVGDVKKLIAE